MKLRKLINEDPICAYETVMDIIKTEGDWIEFLSYSLEDDDIKALYFERELQPEPMLEKPSLTQEIWLDEMWNKSKDII